MSFTRMERMGIVALSLLLAILIVVKATMHLWVTPPPNAATKELNEAWVRYQQEHTVEQPAKGTYVVNTDSNKTITHHSQPAQPKTPVATKLFYFDPNTLDSLGFRKLGLREKTTAILLHWRAKGKIFYKAEDLKRVYTLKPEEYERIAPYVRIKSGKDDNIGE